MKYTASLGLIGLLLMSGCQNTLKSEEATKNNSNITSKIEPVQFLVESSIPISLATSIDGYLQKEAFNGAVLIASGDEIILNKGYGWANIEKKEVMTTEKKFQIASVSKSFVAVSILQLMEQGKISLEQTIDQYFPDMPNSEKITIHHLLSHTSALSSPDASNGSSIETTIEELIKPAFAENNLRSEVGINGSYSNLGYDLLGVIIKKISGLPYREYLKTNILDPLEMHDTGLNDLGLELDNMATSYGGNINNSIETPYFHPSFGYSSGGLHSTALDLYKYDRALAQNKLISKESYDLLSSKHSTIGSKDYGYGFYVNVWIDNIISHPGNLYGWHSMLLRSNDDRVTVIFLTNHDGSDMNMAYEIANFVLSNTEQN